MEGFIVMFDDGMGIIVPYGWDDDCEGALSGAADHVAVFESREKARDAIRISRAYASLCEAQGKVANSDFTSDGDKRAIKIVPLKKAGA